MKISEVKRECGGGRKVKSFLRSKMGDALNKKKIYRVCNLPRIHSTVQYETTFSYFVVHAVVELLLPVYH